MLEHLDLDALDQIVAQHWASQMSAVRLSQSECALRLPFSDGLGDPIMLSVRQHDGEIHIDDAGAVAGAMYSLGEHTEDSPAFRLLQALANSYALQIDHLEGAIRCQMAPDTFIEALSDFAKVVLTVLTASPHLARPTRRARPTGPRLKKRIADGWRERHISKYVVESTPMTGYTVKQWPSDFHWRRSCEPTGSNVFVLAADLKVTEPLDRAQRVSAIALDTKDERQGDNLRVVIDTEGAEQSGHTAAEFIRHHGQELAYEVYDIGQAAERGRFFDQAADELLSEGAREWRSALLVQGGQ